MPRGQTARRRNHFEYADDGLHFRKELISRRNDFLDYVDPPAAIEI
jgi:hypothetical protein